MALLFGVSVVGVGMNGIGKGEREKREKKMKKKKKKSCVCCDQNKNSVGYSLRVLRSSSLINQLPFMFCVVVEKEF